MQILEMIYSISVAVLTDLCLQRNSKMPSNTFLGFKIYVTYVSCLHQVHFVPNFCSNLPSRALELPYGEAAQSIGLVLPSRNI